MREKRHLKLHAAVRQAHGECIKTSVHHRCMNLSKSRESCPQHSWPILTVRMEQSCCMRCGCCPPIVPPLPPILLTMSWTPLCVLSFTLKILRCVMRVVRHGLPTSVSTSRKTVTSPPSHVLHTLGHIMSSWTFYIRLPEEFV